MFDFLSSFFYSFSRDFISQISFLRVFRNDSERNKQRKETETLCSISIKNSSSFRVSPPFVAVFSIAQKIYSALIRCTLLCHRTKYRRHMVWKIDREKSSFEMNKNWKFLVLNSNCFSHIVVLCCRTRIYMRLFFTN